VASVDGLVYLLDRQVEPREEERLLCLDARDGASVWQQSYAVEYGKLDYGNGPRSTPTVDEGLVYTLGAVGHLMCTNARTGKLAWKKDLVKEFGSQLPTWGLAASPVVWRDLVIVHPGAKDGGCLLAFDKKSGEPRWRAGDDPAGYATPVVIAAPSGPQLVAWTPANVRGIDPETGELLWSVPYPVTYGVSIATPIYVEETVFVTGYWEGSKAIRLGADRKSAALVWEENKFLRGLMAQPLYRDGYVYSIDKTYGLTCFKLSTGEKQWDDGHRVTLRGRNPQATLVWLEDGDRAIILNEAGDLILASINPQGYRELARRKIIEAKEGSPIWAHPAYAGTRLFARSDSELIAVELPLARSR
jgi:outer membrane protein assembly factor BamB